MSTVRSKDGTTIAGPRSPSPSWSCTAPAPSRGESTAATALAELLPTASLQAVQGQRHSATADVLAPALRRCIQGHQGVSCT
jgi:hypothetical protein